MYLVLCHCHWSRILKIRDQSSSWCKACEVSCLSSWHQLLIHTVNKRNCISVPLQCIWSCCYHLSPVLDSKTLGSDVIGKISRPRGMLQSWFLSLPCVVIPVASAKRMLSCFLPLICMRGKKKKTTQNTLVLETVTQPLLPTTCLTHCYITNMPSVFNLSIWIDTG